MKPLDNSYSDCFEIRRNAKSMHHLCPLTRKLDRDEDISTRETMYMRRKHLKTRLPSSSAVSKMNLIKKDEIIILTGILEYQMERESSYSDNWDAFYDYMRHSMELDFSNNQLINKVKKMFRDSQNWDAFYDYMRDETMTSDFSKKQLINKVKKLKKRFRANQEKANDGNLVSFANTDDEKVFRLSKIIWSMPPSSPLTRNREEQEEEEEEEENNVSFL